MLFKSLASMFFCIVSALTVLPAHAAPEEPTQQDAIDLVNKANAYFKAHGKAKLLEAVSTPKGEFHKGELYVFVYDQTATILAHPVNSKLVGKNTFDVPDTDGKFYRKDIVQLAKTKGLGWVDYKYKNPESAKVESKTSYILAVGDMILVAGIYKN